MAANRPKGTRDFLPETMAARQKVIQTVRETFELFGFGELQTPAFERIETPVSYTHLTLPTILRV